MEVVEQRVWLAMVFGVVEPTWMVGVPAPLASDVTLWGAPCGNVVGAAAAKKGLRAARIISVGLPTNWTIDARMSMNADTRRLWLRLEGAGNTRHNMLVKYDEAGAVADITLATQFASALRVVTNSEEVDETSNVMVLKSNSKGTLQQYGEPTLISMTSCGDAVILLSDMGSQAKDHTKFLGDCRLLTVLDKRDNILKRHLLMYGDNECVTAALAVNNEDVQHAGVKMLVDALWRRDERMFGAAFREDAVTSDVSYGGIMPTTWVYEDKRLIHPQALLSGAAATWNHEMEAGVGVLIVTNRPRGAMIVLASELKQVSCPACVWRAPQ